MAEFHTPPPFVPEILTTISYPFATVTLLRLKTGLVTTNLHVYEVSNPDFHLKYAVITDSPTANGLTCPVLLTAATATFEDDHLTDLSAAL